MGKIELTEISKQYPDHQGELISVLRQVSLSWKVGENIGIIGESGSGKSTLARIIVGLEKPDCGTVYLNNDNVTKLNLRQMRKYRRILQGVFQDASGTLNPRRSVYRNVEEALCNLTDLTPQERKERIFELMDLTGMKHEIFNNKVRQLSGGEQRRVALLRALAIHPRYLVLDEVTSGLDVTSADAVLNILERYHQEYGCNYLMITHQLEYAYRISDKIYKIRNGVFSDVAYKNKHEYIRNEEREVQ